MKWKLLLVDDESTILDTLAELLTDDDLDVIKARNGKEGLQLLRDEEIDVVVSDIAMPEMDGLTMYSMARAMGIFVPQIFFSAHIRPEQMDSLMASGVNAVVPKPHFEKLSAEINSILVKNEFMGRDFKAEFLPSHLIQDYV